MLWINRSYSLHIYPVLTIELTYKPSININENHLKCTHLNHLIMPLFNHRSLPLSPIGLTIATHRAVATPFFVVRPLLAQHSSATVRGAGSWGCSGPCLGSNCSSCVNRGSWRANDHGNPWAPWLWHGHGRMANSMANGMAPGELKLCSLQRLISRAMVMVRGEGWWWLVLMAKYID